MEKNRFENQIIKIKDDLLELLKNVKTEHINALDAIQTHDVNASKRIIETDREIRKIAESITTTAIWRIAANQPFGRDLRKIIGYMNIIRDLERISNYANNIAKFNIKYLPEPFLVAEISNLMSLTFEIIDLIAEAIETEDLNLAYQAAKKDKTIDTQYKKALVRIASAIRKGDDEQLIQQYAEGIQQLKYVERLGDHLVNICETIVYIIKGKFFDLSSPVEDQ